jgi:hypothetical protein
LTRTARRRGSSTQFGNLGEARTSAEFADETKLSKL